MSTALPKAMVIVNGDDVHHDLISAALVYQQIGIEAGFVTRRAMGLSRFVNPEPVTADNDVFLFYTAGGVFATPQQQALAEMVAAGKGAVAVHGANIMGWDGDKIAEAWKPLFKLFGSHYVSHGPGHHEGYHQVDVIAPEHPIMQGVSTFKLFDEYYEFNQHDDDIEVLATRTRADGTKCPIVYTRNVGKGRVVYVALGHDMRSWGEPPARQILRQALRWASGITA